MRCPGSGVVLDCIDYWYLPSHFLSYWFSLFHPSVNPVNTSDRSAGNANPSFFIGKVTAYISCKDYDIVF